MKNNAIFGVEEAKTDLIREKESLRKTALFIGLVLVIVEAIGLLFGTLYLNITALFGISSTAAIEFINDPFGNQLVNHLLSLVMFTLPFLIIISGMMLSFKETVRLSRPKKEGFVSALLLGVAACGFANVGGNLMFNLLAGFGIDIPSYDMALPSGTLGTVITLVGSVMVAPLAEEFAMRGVLLGSLKRYGNRFAILASAVFFGLIHGNLTQIPFAFIVGLALGYAVIKTDSVWTGVIIHAINNLFATLLTIFQESAEPELSTLLNLFFFAVFLFCGFIGLLFMKKQASAALPEDDGPLSVKMAMGRLFSSPMVIIYILVALIARL